VTCFNNLVNSMMRIHFLHVTKRQNVLVDLTTSRSLIQKVAKSVLKFLDNDIGSDKKKNGIGCIVMREGLHFVRYTKYLCNITNHVVILMIGT
jgi:hypothetical protein